MRCNAENGGSDRKAYLIVPEENIQRAKEELHKYLHAIKAGLYTKGIQTAPTDANIDDTRAKSIYLLKQLGQIWSYLKILQPPLRIWKHAPPAVRQTNMPGLQQQMQTKSNVHAMPMSTPAGVNNATHKHSQEEDKSSGRQTKQMQSSGKMNDHTDGTTASTVSKTAS
jgi:hypothetical protein